MNADGTASATAGPREPGMWPFLVGSSKRASQQVILAPDFMLALGMTGLLVYAAGKAPLPDGAGHAPMTWCCPVGEGEADLRTEGLSVGLSIVFRVIAATPEIVGEHGDVLMDDSSRTVHLAEGVVVLSAAPALTEGVFTQVHQLAQGAFRNFWTTGTRHSGPVPTRPLRRLADAAEGPVLVTSDLPAVPYEELPKAVAAAQAALADEPPAPIARVKPIRPTWPSGQRLVAGPAPGGPTSPPRELVSAVPGRSHGVTQAGRDLPLRAAAGPPAAGPRAARAGQLPVLLVIAAVALIAVVLLVVLVIRPGSSPGPAPRPSHTAQPRVTTAPSQ